MFNKSRTFRRDKIGRFAPGGGTTRSLPGVPERSRPSEPRTQVARDLAAAQAAAIRRSRESGVLADDSAVRCHCQDLGRGVWKGIQVVPAIRAFGAGIMVTAALWGYTDSAKAQTPQTPVVVSDPAGSVESAPVDEPVIHLDPQDRAVPKPESGPVLDDGPRAKPVGQLPASLRVKVSHHRRHVQYACDEASANPYAAKRDFNLGTDQEVAKGEVRCLDKSDRAHSIRGDWGKRLPEFKLRRK